MNIKMAVLVLCVLLSYCVAQSAGDTMSERDSTEGMRKDKALDRIRRMEVPAGKHSQVEDMTGTTKSVGTLISVRQRRDEDYYENKLQEYYKEQANVVDKLYEQAKNVPPFKFGNIKLPKKSPTNKDGLIKPLLKKQVQIGNFDVTLELVDLRDNFKMKPK